MDNGRHPAQPDSPSKTMRSKDVPMPCEPGVKATAEARRHTPALNGPYPDSTVRDGESFRCRATAG